MDYDAIFSALPDRDADFGRCFAFSVHKSGSTMLGKMIADVCRRRDLPNVSIPNFFFSEGISAQDWKDDARLAPVFTRDILYYGFRFLPPVLQDPQVGLRKSRFVLLVRDPRDALVSQYFSYGKASGSHAVPKKNAEAFIAVREALPERSIDEYVIDVSRQLRNKLTAYRDHLNFDLGLVRRYEDVFFDKKTFLREIFEHFGVDVPRGVIAKVAAKHDIRPEQEDETRHIRKGTPGDHQEKLLPETIEKLNDTFRKIGRFYGYEM